MDAVVLTAHTSSVQRRGSREPRCVHTCRSLPLREATKRSLGYFEKRFLA